MKEKFSKERCPFGKGEKRGIEGEKKMAMSCEGYVQMGHSFEECPYINEEKKNEIRSKWERKRLRNIIEDRKDI